jgi:general stress protein 26
MSTPAVQGQSIEKILEAVLSTMKAEPYCFFITIDWSGHPHARMVEATSIETDFRVWMITGPETRKVGEIRENERAALAFSDNKGEGYVTLSGSARVVDDPAKKKLIWKFEYGAFFRRTRRERLDTRRVHSQPNRDHAFPPESGHMALDDEARLSYPPREILDSRTMSSEPETPHL